MRQVFFPPSKTTAQVASEIGAGDCEVIVSGFHRNRNNCQMFMKAGTKNVTWRTDENDPAIFLSSFATTDGLDGWVDNGDGTYSTVIRWSGGPSENIMYSDKSNIDFKYMVKLNWLSNNVTFNDDSTIFGMNLRLDHLQSGDLISIKSDLNNGLYTVKETIVDNNVQKIRVEETLVNDSASRNVSIRLAHRQDLANYEYMMEYATPERGFSTITVKVPNINNVIINLPFLTSFYCKDVENITYHGIKIICTVGQMSRVNNITVDNCHFSWINGKAMFIDSTQGLTNNIRFTHCLVTDCVEGFYDIGGPHGFMDGFYVGYCYFKDMNFTHPNAVPAADGHSVGFMNGKNKVVEYCVTQNTQGVPYAYYGWDFTPDVCDNVGFRHIYVDTVKEYIPGTAGSIQGVTIQGDGGLRVGTQTNQFIEDCVVRNLQGYTRPDGRKETSIAYRYKTSDSLTEASAFKILNNYAIDSEIGFRWLKVIDPTRVHDYGNTSIRCGLNKKYSSALTQSLSNISADNNAYDERGTYVFEGHGALIDFKTFKDRASQRLNSQAHESMSVELSATEADNVEKMEAEKQIMNIMNAVGIGGSGQCEAELAVAKDQISSLELEKSSLLNQITSIEGNLLQTQADLLVTKSRADDYLNKLEQIEQISGSV